MHFNNFPSPHCHVDSLDTASTPEAFADREVSLGTGTITATDHGTMASCRRIYELADKKGLTPIMGVEGYFRDDDCPILLAHGIERDEKKTFASYNKYYHVTIHALNQAAYERLVYQISIADQRAETHGSERKPLFTWAQLEDLGQYDITMTSGCLVGMVQRHLLGDRPDLASAYYKRMRSLVKQGNFYVELFSHRCDKNWDNAVYITLEGGETLRFYNGKTLETDAGEVKAEQLARYPTKHKQLRAVKNYRTWDPLKEGPKTIVSVKAVQDFIQNDCKPWCPDGDVQLGCNRFMYAMAKRHGDHILISDDAHFATPDEKIIQDCKLGGKGDTWRFYGSYHRQTSEEAFAYFNTYMGISEEEFADLVSSNQTWAARFKDFSVKGATPWKTEVSLPLSFYPKDTMKHLKMLIDKHGRMNWANTEMVERLKTEIDLLHKNGKIDLFPYFFLGEEVCSLYRDRGMLTGPGRGSAAGLLLTFLLGITHVNPLRYNLSRDRFITVDRIRSGKLPDIDQDLPDVSVLTDPENGWLKKRFGDNYAQISTDTQIRLKSAIKDVARALASDHRVPPDIDKLANTLPSPPQGVKDSKFVFGYIADDGKEVRGLFDTHKGLQAYAKRYPKHWEIVQKMMGITRQKSRHACAYVIADRPIHEFIPLTTIGEVKVTQYTAKSVEAVGGLKMDFLGLNSLRDIGDCVRIIQETRGLDPGEFRILPERGKVPKHHLVPDPHQDGVWYDVWDGLPDDQEVFNKVAEGMTETVFQFNTESAKMWLKAFNYEKEPGVKAIDSVEAMSAFTALDRPGPLDAMVGGENGHNMMIEYANRAKGLAPTDPIPFLDERLIETYGVMVYQEQLQNIYQQLMDCDGIAANKFRESVAKKQVDDVNKAYGPFFEAASKKIGAEQAQQLWDLIYTWGQYGFNKSHSICYSVLAYACVWLKHHYSLEWWCAVLRNASKKEVAEKFWSYCGHLVDFPDIKLSGANFEIRNGRIRAPLGFLSGVGEGAQEELAANMPYASIEDFCAKRESTKSSKSSMVPDKKNPGKMKPKKGTSALNKGVVTKLIVGGAMDGLFEPGATTLDKLEAFARASGAACGKKKPDPIDEKYLTMTPLMQYQLKKAILPVYSERIVPMLYRADVDGVEKREENGREVYRYQSGNHPSVRFVESDEIDYLLTQQLEVGQEQTVAVAGFLADERAFTYKDGAQRAVDYTLEVNGKPLSFVAWPNKKTGSISTPEGIAGSIVVMILGRWSDRFSIKKIVVVQEPLASQKEEESA